MRQYGLHPNPGIIESQPMNRARLQLFVAISTLVASPAMSFAETLDPRLIGAWLTSSADCKKVFESKGGNISFRPPVDEFSQAFIIRPRQVIAPGGQCRITSIARDGDTTSVGMDCNNTVGFGQVAAKFIVTGATTMQQQPGGNPLLTQSYEKCPN
jgi:hypothetical protein